MNAERNPERSSVYIGTVVISFDPMSVNDSLTDSPFTVTGSLYLLPPYSRNTSPRLGARSADSSRCASLLKEASTRATRRSLACFERLQESCVRAKLSGPSFPPVVIGSMWSTSNLPACSSRSMACPQIKQCPFCDSWRFWTKRSRSSLDNRLKYNEGISTSLVMNRVRDFLPILSEPRESLPRSRLQTSTSRPGRRRRRGAGPTRPRRSLPTQRLPSCAPRHPSPPARRRQSCSRWATVV